MFQNAQTKTLVFLLLIMFGLAGWTLFRLWGGGDSAQERTSDTPSALERTDTADLVDNAPENTATRLEVDAGTAEVDNNTVVYRGGFTPLVRTVRKGETITFSNQDTRPIWPASNQHPSHTNYPQKSATDCLGSSFDACKPVPPGSEWSFTFTESGTWDYHDHLDSKKGGRIVVE